MDRATTGFAPSLQGRFVPGSRVAERCRIAGLVSRGGMGEVYRAEDLRLGQVVALEFLPLELSDDPALLERFYAEVRLGRKAPPGSGSNSSRCTSHE